MIDALHEAAAGIRGLDQDELNQRVADMGSYGDEVTHKLADLIRAALQTGLECHRCESPMEVGIIARHCEAKGGGLCVPRQQKGLEG